ncbi:hypothetical protein PO909_003193 [Leuciscus waleckii]
MGSATDPITSPRPIDLLGSLWLLPPSVPPETIVHTAPPDSSTVPQAPLQPSPCLRHGLSTPSAPPDSLVPQDPRQPSPCLRHGLSTPSAPAGSAFAPATPWSSVARLCLSPQSLWPYLGC